jgi:ribulose-5-phosphate 4-epimerase/fuculose-1-phosphate aldolase
MSEEGVIKFNCQWTRSAPLDESLIIELNAFRDKLYTLGLLGVKDGIGYGNISVRSLGTEFIITGSGTGTLNTLTSEHYAMVTDYNINKNTVCSTGSIVASSESLTHAMVYEKAVDANAVIHAHHFNIWKNLLANFPSTASDIQYGTPEMANEIARLFDRHNLSHHKRFAMAGHHEGVVCFGNSLEEAAEILLQELAKVKS